MELVVAICLTSSTPPMKQRNGIFTWTRKRTPKDLRDAMRSLRGGKRSSIPNDVVTIGRQIHKNQRSKSKEWLSRPRSPVGDRRVIIPPDSFMGVFHNPRQLLRKLANRCDGIWEWERGLPFHGVPGGLLHVLRRILHRFVRHVSRKPKPLIIFTQRRAYDDGITIA